MGALIIVGDGPEVLNICSGGFLLDAAFSPQRLSELAKMDGAIILASDASRIARANVHLVPDPNVPTSETGTRHRTAERVARSIGVPVISVSEDMSIIAVYVRSEKHPLEDIPRLLNRANQALQALERYKTRLDAVSGALSALEVEDLVTLRDVRHGAAAHRDGACASPTRSTATSSSSASTAASFDCSSTSSSAASRTTDASSCATTSPRTTTRSIEYIMNALGALDTDELLDLRRSRPPRCIPREPEPISTAPCSRVAIAC